MTAVARFNILTSGDNRASGNATYEAPFDLGGDDQREHIRITSIVDGVYMLPRTRPTPAMTMRVLTLMLASEY